MLLNAIKLCLVTKPEIGNLDNYLEFLKLAIKGGVTCVQLRDKSHSLTKAWTLKNFLEPLNIPLIINDNVQIAKKINAQGVHLGQSDMSPQKARQLLGEEKIIGLTIENEAELYTANQIDCIDYVGIGALFPSTTKTNCKRIWGMEDFKQIAPISRHPIVAIGGITKDKVKNIISAGATGIAVVSAIHNSLDPEKEAFEFLQELKLGLQDVQTRNTN